MTSASSQMVTRCPKCATAFRITSTQLQSAKGAVRCGSCLHVFKAQDYLVKPVAAIEPTASPVKESSAPPAPVPTPVIAKEPAAAQPKTPVPAAAKEPLITPAKTPLQAISKEPSAIPANTASTTVAKPGDNTAKPVAGFAAKTPPPTSPNLKVFDKSSLDQIDDILISDDMDAVDKGKSGYEFDGFMDLDLKPKVDVSLFERRVRDRNDAHETKPAEDESWAEMLIDDDDDIPRVGVIQKSAAAIQEEEITAAAAAFHETARIQPEAPITLPQETKAPAANPGLIFSLVGDSEPASPQSLADDDFIISDELARMPNASGFTPAKPIENPAALETLAEEPPSNKRQIKTEPKIRAYDSSRTALLMNIIPGPVEFTAKRIRRWYQKKLWPTLSLLALFALLVQISWFKFDYFSRVEPYRTAYTFICPLVGCQVPTLVDKHQISAYNLVVRAHPETANALLVDAIILNKAPFDQPFPDLELAFTDLDEKPIASRRFTPREYLGGELAGRELMPQNQPIHLTLDLVDPGPNAVNYHVSIPR